MEVGCERVRTADWESWDSVLGEKEEEVLLVRLCSDGCEVREPGEGGAGREGGGWRERWGGREGEEGWGGEGRREGRERRGRKG